LNELDEFWINGTSSTTTEVQLLANIDSLDMRLWVKDGWRSGIETLASSGTKAATLRTKGALPTGLEFSLRLIDHDNKLLKLFLLGAV
jgi:hypothetical protein